MRIALLTEKYPPDEGGLAVSAHRLARGLVSAGHAVEVFALSGRLAPGEADCAADGGLLVRSFGQHRRADDTLAVWFGVLTARHAEQPFDLLHAYFLPQAGFVAAYAGRYLGVHSVVSARGNDLDRAVFDPGKSAHVRFALERASAVTANTRDLARKAAALAPGQTVRLIPNGVDSQRFAPRPADPVLAASLGLEGRPCLGFVGQARAKKGLAALLIAYRGLAASSAADCIPHLLLIGGVRADDKDTLRVFQKQNPGLPVQTVTGIAPEALPPYYNLLDVLLMPSLQDGLPNALLEGMASGCAVLATSAGGIPDAIRHGENGLLVPPGNAPALADALAALLADPALRGRLGQAARATATSDFTLEREVALNLELYQSL